MELEGESSGTATPPRAAGLLLGSSRNNLSGGSSEIEEHGTRRQTVLLGAEKNAIIGIAVDYEKTLLQEEWKKEPFQDLIFCPSVDLKVLRTAKQRTTIEPVVTTDMMNKAKGTPVEMALKSFTEDLVSIVKEDQKFDGLEAPPAFEPPPAFEEGEWPENKAAKEIFLSVEILRGYKPEDDERDRTRRASANRCSIYRVFDGLCIPRPTDRRRNIQPLESVNRAVKVLVDCTGLSFGIGNVEPYFISAALYDVAKKLRISEYWSFELNNDEQLQMLGNTMKPRSEGASSPTAIFSISNCNTDIYLIVRVEQVYKGVDVETNIAPYLKGPSIKPKEKDKLMRDAEVRCQKMGKYHQPFVWGGICLFGEGGTLNVGTATQCKLFRQKPDDGEFQLIDLVKKKRESTTKERKTIPAEFTFNFKIVQGSNIEGRLDPSLNALEPFPSGTKIIRIQQEFVEPKEKTEPMIEYINNIYIIPESVNFSRHKENARNIFVRIKIKDNDNNLVDEGLKIICGNCLESKFEAESLSSITYHKKNPMIFQEAKAILPVDISQNHHVLFGFYNCSGGNKKESTLEAFLGFAIIPLVSDGKLLEPGRLSVPVASGLVPNYTSPDQESNLKWIDNKKPCFTFRTEVVSSIYPQDDNLSEFLRQCYGGADNKQLTMALKKLRNVEQHVIVRYFTFALPLLLEVICRPSETQAKEAFESLVVVAYSVATVGGQGSRSELLQSWVSFNFRNVENSTKILWNEIPVQWVDLLKTNESMQPKSLQLSWFFFDLIIKSMTLSLHARNRLDPNRNRNGDFPDSFREVIDALLKIILLNIVRSKGQQPDVAHSVALFLKDLFALMDRGFVMSQVHNLITRMDARNLNPVLGTLKFACLSIILDYRYYLQLNRPISISITSVPTIATEFCTKFPLVGLLLTELAGALQSKYEEVTNKAIETLQNILRKHDLDERYQDAPKKEKIATMYFPLIPLCIECVDKIEKLGDGGVQLLGCILYVLQNGSRSVVRSWWKLDTQKSILSFLKLLLLAVHAFESDHMVRESGLVVLDIIEDLMEDLREDMAQEGSPILEATFEVVMSLLRNRQTVSAYSCLLASCRRFIYLFKSVIFGQQSTTYCGDLCYELLRLTNSVNATTRAEAGSLIYLMLKTNFTTTQNFSRMKLQSTIAVSRLCGEAKLTTFQYLQKTLEYVARLSKKEFPDDPDRPEGNLGWQVEDLTNRLFKVISDSMKISEFSFDPEMTADLYYRVSLGYTDSPVLRITWLENLARFHRDNENYEEVAQCKFCIAALISEFLVTVSRENYPGIPQSVDEFVCLSPNILDQPKLPNTSREAGEEGLFNSKLFTEDGLVDTLTQAIDYLKKGSRYETCIDVYNILLELHQSHRNYQQLATCFQELKSVCDSLCQANQGHSRIFASYYRVGFYGKGWKDQHNKEYIYKEHATVRVADFSQRIQAQFSTKYGADKIKMLPNKQVNMAELDTELLYLQIVSVEPYFNEEELQTRITEWDRNFNIQRFIYESPFTLDGKAHGDISSQCKRKTILTVDRSFPYVRKRSLVQETAEEILSPLENAIEIIQQRERALRRELNLSPPNLKTLQINLQGAVLAQVNAGPIEIARTFLGKEATKHPRHHIENLSNILSEFLNMCAFALKLNKTLIGPEQLDFQTECEKGYENLKEEVNGLISQTAGLTINFR